MIPGAPQPQRALRHAMKSLPERAERYCDAATQASAFGWWVFPPMDFRAVLHGGQILWSYGAQRSGFSALCHGRDVWFPLGDAQNREAQFPDFSDHFDARAPADLRLKAPYFLTSLAEPGILQIWTGYFVRCAPGWSLLTRAPANMPPHGAYTMFEGIVEADAYFAPVFTNILLTQPDEVVNFACSRPLIQIQAVPREAYDAAALDSMKIVDGIEAMTPDDWEDYRATIGPKERRARYAIEARRRRKAACPFASA